MHLGDLGDPPRAPRPGAAARLLRRSLAAERDLWVSRSNTWPRVDGVERFLSWRKYDQGARGTRLWLPRGRTDLCKGKALEALN